MSLAVGTHLLDSAVSIDPRAAYAQGSRAQFRYSAGAGNNAPAAQWKLCKPGEIASIIASGQDFIANSEWYETRVTEGAAAGAQDGAADLVFWQSRGLAQGSTIVVSWDSAPSPALYPNVIAYLQAYNKALRGFYLGDGLYAGLPAILAISKVGVIKHGWVTESASWSCPRVPLPPGYAPPAVTSWDLWEPTAAQLAPAIRYLQGLLTGHKLESCVWQTGNHWMGNQADENVILISGTLGSHKDHFVPTPPKPAPTPPAPSTQEEDMRYIRFPDDMSNPPYSNSAVYGTDGSCLSWLTGIDYASLGDPAVAMIKPHQDSNLYKLPIAPGQNDPRKPGVTA